MVWHLVFGINTNTTTNLYLYLSIIRLIIICLVVYQPWHLPGDLLVFWQTTNIRNFVFSFTFDRDQERHLREKGAKRKILRPGQILPIYWPWRQKSLFLTGTGWKFVCLLFNDPTKEILTFSGPSKIKYIWALIRLFDATTFSIFVSLFLFSSFVPFPCMFCHRFWTLSELLLSWVQFSWRSRKTGFSTAEFSAGEQFLSRRLSLEKVPEHHRHKVKDMTEICVKECRCLTTK